MVFFIFFGAETNLINNAFNHMRTFFWIENMFHFLKVFHLFLFFLIERTMILGSLKLTLLLKVVKQILTRKRIVTKNFTFEG